MQFPAQEGIERKFIGLQFEAGDETELVSFTDERFSHLFEGNMKTWILIAHSCPEFKQLRGTSLPFESVCEGLVIGYWVSFELEVLKARGIPGVSVRAPGRSQGCLDWRLDLEKPKPSGTFQSSKESLRSDQA
jgi:hypothetical protein